MKTWSGISLLVGAAILVAGCTSTPPKKTADKPAEPVKESGPVLPGHYKEIKFPEFKYVLPHPSDYRVELEGGHVAFLVKDTNLDLISIEFMFDSENYTDKPKETALHSLYSSLLYDGGTKEFTPAQLEDSLEYIAAGIHASLGNHTSSLSIDALSKDTYPMLDLLAKVALSPRFDKSKLTLHKKKIVEAIKHRYDRPRSVLSLAYEHVNFGSHPFNWLSTVKEVNGVSRSRLKKLTGLGFGPQRIVVSVAGKFEKDVMVKALNEFVKKFGDMQPAKPDSITPAFSGPKKPGVYIVDKDLTQASIQVGFPGVKRPHPDYYKLTVANYIFGSGGFTSRLTLKVRTEAGLAYSVRSFVQSSYYRQGTVGFILQTKTESGAQAIKLSFDEMQKMVEKGVTAEELKAAKDALVQSLPSLFDTPASTANIFAQSEIWNRDKDHFVNYPKIISEVTLEEVNAVFKKYFIKDSARVVVVGPVESLVKNPEASANLDQFGKVSILSTEEIEAKTRN